MYKCTYNCSSSRQKVYICGYDLAEWLEPLERLSANAKVAEEIRVEEKQKELICPLSWSVHNNLARDGYKLYSLPVAVSNQVFLARKQKWI